MANKINFVRFRGLDYACKEALNELCTNITFVGANKRIIMFTSTEAHEGKSFLSMNTMRTMASMGKKVVLVDCDLRKSQIGYKYGVKIEEGKGYGTVHYLARMCNLEDVVYETSIPGAYMVPVGREVTNSLALLNTPDAGSGHTRLYNMLQTLAKRFDYVLVDAPPVGVIIDAAEIAKACDGAIFAVKYNKVSRRDVADAKAQIDRAGCEVLGAVLNDVDMDSLSSKKYYNKSYYNHYNSDYYKPSGSEERPRQPRREERRSSGKRPANRR